MESGAWKPCAQPQPQPAQQATDPITASPSFGSNPTASPDPYAGGFFTAAGSSSSSPAPGTRPPVLSAQGEVCQLPLTYNGAEIDNCVSIAGEACRRVV